MQEAEPAGGGAKQALLSVRDLRTHFMPRSGWLGRGEVLKAVDGVSFDIGPGETLGLVGESGCGKTTVGRTILRLVAQTSGEVRFVGRDVFAAGRAELRRLRREMQIVFQDPGGSLNPRMRVGAIVGEPLVVHRMVKKKAELERKVGELLERCGMPASAAERFPHQFSGGQRQRIGIARALALGPRLLVCDEPTSALDVSVQAQILNLLKDLQRDFRLSCLFISHDMNVIGHMCDRIAVMWRGRIVEAGPRDDVLLRPSNDYTKRLLAAVPRVGFGAKRGVRPEKGVGRCVVLRHDLPDGTSHLDWMLERRDPAAGLLSFRLSIGSDVERPGVIEAERIGDHRREYLEREGPVSGGRGSVRRLASLEVVELVESEDRVRAVVRGRDGTGVVWVGERKAGDRWLLSGAVC
ncbi:MAG: ATP-binding cassette domain-containing protein [Phycisphaerales bacterium]